MKNEFIPYKQALELKELEFDEDCFGYYAPEMNGKYYLFTINRDEIGSANSEMYNPNSCSAPVYQQAFRWFREKYGFYPLIEMNEQFHKWLSRYCNIDGSIAAISVHDTYEEAELACLKRLIEIAKNK